MGTDTRPRQVMIVAGEASGDQHGALLVRALRSRRDGIGLFGIGGKALEAAGVDIFEDAAALSVVGVTEVFAKLPDLWRARTRARAALKQLRPDLLVLIDFPDFNLNLAAFAKRLGIPVLYYISPQIWAWRPGRIKKIGRRVDHVAVILPFEEAFYRKNGIPVTFVGHPLLDARAPDSPMRGSDDNAGPPTIGLLPGSRDKEVARHLPVMLAAAGILEQRVTGVRFVVSVAPSVAQGTLEHMVARQRASGGRPRIRLETGPVRRVFEQSRLAVAASGTVTLEAAMAGTPMVIVYKVSPVSFRIAKALVRVPHIGLTNLIAGREVVPELIQEDANPQKIADTVCALLEDPQRLERMRLEMAAVRGQLGQPGIAGRVADIALGMMH